MDEHQDIEMINRYLRHEMTEQERSDIADRIENDQAFRATYMDLRSIQLGLKADDLEDKLKMLQNLESDSVTQNISDSARRSSSSWIWIGALLLGITGLLWYLVGAKPEKSLEKPPMAEFSEYVRHDRTRSAIPVANVDKEKAYDLFVLREFEEAIPLLEDLWEEENDTLALYYLGVSYHFVGEVEKSQKLLDINTFNTFKKPQ